MEKDFSKKTVAILLSIAVILSVLVTFMNISKAPTNVQQGRQSSNLQSAQVSLVVQPGPDVLGADVSVEVIPKEVE